MDELISKAIKLAKDYLKNSYSPYSGVKVASVAITSSGEMFTGVNVENSSYGLSMCAERVAIFKAVSEGHRDIKTVVIVSNRDGFTYPCGACLQVMSEFNVETIVVTSPNGEVRVHRLSELFPMPFKLK
jgi:cytidine deaminase